MMMDDRFYPRTRTIRSRIHMRTETNDRNDLISIRRQSSIYIPKLIQVGIRQTRIFQLLYQQPAQVLLFLRRGEGSRLRITLCIDLHVTEKSFRHTKSIIAKHIRKLVSEYNHYVRSG